MECPICIEHFNKMKHKKIECKFCNYSACRDCLKRYLLDSTLEPTCMNCKVAWDTEYIRTNMTKVFLDGEYKKHRENMLLSLEESLLPETQEYANFEKSMQKDYNELQKMKQLITDLRHDYNRKHSEYFRKYSRGYRGQGQKEEERKKFVLKCPDVHCRGFLSTQYKCGNCEKYYCKDCHVEKIENHECNEDDKKTIELLTTNTKQCPKCFIPIFKLEGCFMMFCTECHTPFDWNSGKILNGVIHNPHYFEWLRNQDRDIPQNGGDCGDQRGIPHIRSFRFLSIAEQNRLTVLIQTLTHIQHVTIPSLTEHEERFIRNRDLRIKYLNGQVDREYMKWMIQKRDKSSQKKRLMLMLWQMFIMSYTDLLNNLIVNHEFVTFETQSNQLLIYINQELERFGKLYSSKIQMINDRWQMV